MFSGIVLGVVLCASPAAAQNPSVYAGGSITGRSGDTVDRFQLNTEESDAGSMGSVGMSASVGMWVSPRVGIEMEVSRLGSRSLDWVFSYESLGTAMQRTSNRDIPYVGLLRVALFPGRRVDVNLVGGAGLTSHRATSYTTADCGSGFVQLPCKAVDPPQVSDVYRITEFASEFGADVPIRVSSHFSVAPTVRFWKIVRSEWLTGYNHRGPQGGSGNVLIFGCAAVWNAR